MPSRTQDSSKDTICLDIQLSFSSSKWYNLIYTSFLPLPTFYRTGDPEEKMDYPEYARSKDKIIQWILKETDIPSRAVGCDKLQEIRDQIVNNKFVLAYFGSKKNPLFT
jgi:hypothetical protein